MVILQLGQLITVDARDVWKHEGWRTPSSTE